MIYANISEAKSSLSMLIQKVALGEDVIISKAGKPVAKIIPFHEDIRPRKGGQWKGRVTISPDFDETPEDVIKSFYEER